MKQNGFWAAMALVQLAASPALAAGGWHFDAAHSSAQFRIKHMMVSNVTGTIHGINGKVDYDGMNLKGLKVEAQLDPATIETGEPNRDKHLKSGDFFDVAKYPAISFKSKKIIGAKGHYKMVGDLTMHGVTKEVAMDMDDPTPVVKDPKGNEHVGTSARAKIKRSDFGISWNSTLDQGGVMLGDPVDVTLDIDLVKDKGTAQSEGTKKAG